MSKKYISVLLIVALIFMIGSPAFAAQSVEENISPQTDGYYYWEIDKIEEIGEVSGEWIDGPKAVGPYSESKTVSVSVSNTISGSYTSKSEIGAALGVEIGVTFTETSSGTLIVPSGHYYKMIYRPYYTRYKVTECQYYRIDGYSTKTGQTKVSYVDVFEDIDFDKEVIY